jgi:hypothetical protein
MKILLVSITLFVIVAQPAMAHTMLVAMRSQECIDRCLAKSKNRDQANACINKKCGDESMGGAANEVVIPHGCPYNLDKVCQRNRKGKLVHCHCAS